MQGREGGRGCSNGRVEGSAVLKGVAVARYKPILLLFAKIGMFFAVLVYVPIVRSPRAPTTPRRARWCHGRTSERRYAARVCEQLLSVTDGVLCRVG